MTYNFKYGYKHGHVQGDTIVPYLAVREPSNQSDFTDLDLRLLLTGHAYKIELLEEDAKECSRLQMTIEDYIEYILQKHIRTVIEQYNISFIDMITDKVSDNMIAFSGTTLVDKVEFGNFPCVFGGMEVDRLGQGSVLEAIENVVTIPDKTLKSIVATFSPGSVAIIDCGAWFSEFGVKDYITQLRQLIPHSIVYLNDNHEQQVDLGTDDYCYFFDQKHTVGVDVQMKPIVHGVVTVSDNTRWTEVSQGAFRMRGLHYGHTASLLTTKDTTLPDIINALYVNDEIKKQKWQGTLCKQIKRTIKRYKNAEPNDYIRVVRHPSEFSSSKEELVEEFGNDSCDTDITTTSTSFSINNTIVVEMNANQKYQDCLLSLRKMAEYVKEHDSFHYENGDLMFTSPKCLEWLQVKISSGFLKNFENESDFIQISSTEGNCFVPNKDYVAPDPNKEENEPKQKNEIPFEYSEFDVKPFFPIWCTWTEWRSLGCPEIHKPVDLKKSSHFSSAVLSYVYNKPLSPENLKLIENHDLYTDIVELKSILSH